MPSRLPLKVRYTILCLKDRNWDIASIAKLLELPYNSVKTWYNRDTVNDKARNMKYVSDRDLRKMKRDLKETRSLRKTGKLHGHSHVFISQKCRRSAANPNGLYPYRCIKTLRLTVGQKAKRVAYIQTMPYQNKRSLLRRLQRKLIYDEKPFELGHPPNKQTNPNWAENIEQVDQYPMDKHPSKLMIMAAITYWTKSDLYIYVIESKYVKGTFSFVCYVLYTQYHIHNCTYKGYSHKQASPKTFLDFCQCTMFATFLIWHSYINRSKKKVKRNMNIHQ